MNTEIFQENYSLELSSANRDESSMNYNAIINSLINEEITKKFSVKVSPKTLNEIKDFKLAFLAKNTNLKGFRKGKAPLNIVWKQHENELTGDIANNTINDAVNGIIAKGGLDLVAPPKIDLKDFSFDKGLEFETTLSLIPAITLPELKSIKLDKPTYEITEADIKERSDLLSTRYKDYKKAKASHKAAIGDKVIMDFEGKIDGVVFDGGTSKGHNLELGSKTFIDNFEEQLVGHKAGDDVLVKVTFPETYHEKKFAGKAAEFAVTINEIQESKAFAKEEDLAKFVGFSSVEELHAKIKESLSKECEDRSLIQMKTQLFDKLDAACDFALPEMLLEDEFKTLWKNVEHLRQQNNPEVNKPEEELREEYQKLAKRRVKLGLLLSEFAKEAKIQVVQDDIINAVRSQAMANPSASQAIIKHYTENPKAVEGLKGGIVEEKSVQYILSQVTNAEKAVKVKKLLEAK